MEASSLAKLRAALLPAQQTQPHFCRTMEIWQQRALLLCPVNLPAQLRCQLYIEIPINAGKTEYEQVELGCTVQLSVLVGQLNQYRVGVKFTDIPEASEKALQRLLRG